MNKGTMGLKAPSLGKSMGKSSISTDASSGMPSMNTGSLGRQVVNMLRGRRQSRQMGRKASRKL